MKSRRFVVVAVVLALAAGACSSESSTTTEAPPRPATTAPTSTTAPPSLSADLDSILQEAVSTKVLPAVGVTVFTSNEIVETAVAGVRKQGDPTPVEIGDKFHIGSNVKAMTATLVGTFVDEGTLTWDATLDDLFATTVSDIDPTMGAITLRQLLSHTGGIDDTVLAPSLALISDAPPLSEQRVEGARTMITHPPTADVGRHLYSNLGYTMVGSALEQLTGQSWEELVASRVFEPLQMDSCGFYAPGTPGAVDQPWGHNTDLGGMPIDPGDPRAEYPHVIAPAGLVHCSMSDWARFLQSQLRGFRGDGDEIVSRSVFEALATPAPGTDYALGWAIAETPGGQVLTHNGSNDRFLAVALLVPNEDWGMLAVTNLGEAMAAESLGAVIDAVIARHLGNAPGAG